MANHSPRADNYVGKKTWQEAMEGIPASEPSELRKADDAAKRTAGKGAAANNGGGDK